MLSMLQQGFSQVGDGQVRLAGPRGTGDKRGPLLLLQAFVPLVVVQGAGKEPPGDAAAGKKVLDVGLPMGSLRFSSSASRAAWQ